MIKQQLAGGKYVVAVSGGVDSVALLHMLRQQASPGVSFVVAHFDHGIRPDSAEDRRYVQRLAHHHGLPFVYHRVELGPDASEEASRNERYKFLHEVRRATGAQAIITAHHQDDVLETVILNLLRGTGSKGLSSLRSSDVVMRPLLQVSKRQLTAYAKLHNLEWREDATNTDPTYLRNYIRHNIIPRLGATGRKQLLRMSAKAAVLNEEIDQHTTHYLHVQPHTHTLRRHDFVLLPHAVARQVMAAWLRARTGVEVNSKLLERLVAAAKTGRKGTTIDISRGHNLKLGRDTITLV